MRAGETGVWARVDDRECSGESRDLSRVRWHSPSFRIGPETTELQRIKRKSLLSRRQRGTARDVDIAAVLDFELVELICNAGAKTRPISFPVRIRTLVLRKSGVSGIPVPRSEADAKYRAQVTRGGARKDTNPTPNSCFISLSQNTRRAGVPLRRRGGHLSVAWLRLFSAYFSSRERHVRPRADSHARAGARHQSAARLPAYTLLFFSFSFSPQNLGACEREREREREGEGNTGGC